MLEVANPRVPSGRSRLRQPGRQEFDVDRGACGMGRNQPATIRGRTTATAALRHVRTPGWRPVSKAQYTSRTYRLSAASCFTYAAASASPSPPCVTAMSRSARSTSLAMREASPHT